MKNFSKIRPPIHLERFYAINKIIFVILILIANGAQAITWECTGDKAKTCLQYGKTVLKNILGCDISEKEGRCDETVVHEKTATRDCYVTSTNCVARENIYDWYAGRDEEQYNLNPCPTHYTEFSLDGYSNIILWSNLKSNGGNEQGVCVKNGTGAAWKIP